MHPLLADPWVAARVDAAVAPYRSLLSSEDLAFLREELAERMSSDELLSLALRRERPRHVDQSGEAFVGRIEQAPQETPQKTSARRGGNRA